MANKAGRILLIPRGDYDANTEYHMLDFVRFQGNSYVAKKTTTGNLPTNTTYWQPLTEIELAYVTPEMFGAVGDGVNDDTTAIQLAVNSEKQIKFDGNKNYKITQRIVLKSNTVYEFDGATITCYDGAGFNVGNTENVTIKDINLIGSEESGYNGRIVCKPKESKADGLKVLNSNIINYFKDSKTSSEEAGHDRSQWAFLGNGSEIIFDNCHIDTHIGACWGGCIHLGYGRNIKITNCWIYGGDDAIAPLPHCGGMFGDLSEIDTGLSVYIDNCWIASWFAYCVGMGTCLLGSESERTEWLPPTDDVEVYITNSKLHNHIFKDGTRNEIAHHYVSCVNCEFVYDSSIGADLGYPYDGPSTFWLVGPNSENDVYNANTSFNFDNCLFDGSEVQYISNWISPIQPIAQLSIQNSKIKNSGNNAFRIAGNITKELLFDNVNWELTQEGETAFIRDMGAESVIIRNCDIVTNSTSLITNVAATNKYIEIANNRIVFLKTSDDVIVRNNDVAHDNATVIIKDNIVNAFCPEIMFRKDNCTYKTNTVIPLELVEKPYLVHRTDFMLVKPQGEAWNLKNLKCIAEPKANSITALTSFKYFVVKKLNEAVIPFDFTEFGNNVIESTPTKTVIKSLDAPGGVSIFKANSSDEYITVTDDFYLYLASGQCGANKDWSTMTVTFDDDTTLDTWTQPTLITAGKVIKEVRLVIKHNGLYQTDNIVYQLSEANTIARGCFDTSRNSLDIYGDTVMYDSNLSWKADGQILADSGATSISKLFVDLADSNVEVIISPIFQEHSFEFDYFVDNDKYSDTMLAISNLQAIAAASSDFADFQTRIAAL
jgi:hypothetical protein